ncbi:hypothetical protein PENTCL1PPCAC_23744, partial [Pristionchus entomophagus]
QMSNAQDCTVLSAEPSIQLSNIDIGTEYSVSVMNGGFESLAAANEVLELKAESVVGSSIVVAGPIATLFKKNQPNNFTFVLKRDAPWSGSLSPGASTTLLSNGWLSPSESYNMDYPNENTRSRSYD